MAKPLTYLTGKKVSWTWTETEQAAFEQLRDQLLSAPILGYPEPDQHYILDTDASDVGTGAVLSQKKDGKEVTIAYFSKTLNTAEANYCVTRKELLAVVKAVKHFRPYLYGQRFTLRTDHASLRWLCRRQQPTAQVARWLELLSEFSYTLEHRAGRQHGNADGLSRQSCVINCKQCARVEARDGGPTHQQLLDESTTTDPLLQQREKSPPSLLHDTEFNLPDISEQDDTDDEYSEEDDLQQIQHIFTNHPQDTINLRDGQKDGNGPVSTIYKVLQHQLELTDEQLALGGVELRRLYQARDLMRIRSDGILEIRVNHQSRPRWCVVCPGAFRHKTVWNAHEMAHAGIQKTTARLRLNWYWHGLTADVRRIINNCEVCQTAKQGGTKNSKHRQRLYAGQPWQKLAADLVGPMPETPRGNRWILVITDHFSRWQDAIPLPDATAPTVATALDERIFCYFGLPEELHTDQGAQFESRLMAELCQLWGIRKTRTTPYHPQGNGVVERGNRSLGDSLRALLINRGAEEWDTLLPQIMRAYRGTPNTTTGETANLLMLGRELKLPDQLTQPPLPAEDYEQPYVIQQQDTLNTAHQLLREKQMRIRAADTEEPPLFAPGDLVLVVNKRRRKKENPKLQQKFVGPYLVITSNQNHTYEIERNQQRSVQHESRLKLYRPCDTRDGQAPGLGEPAMRPSMKGARRKTHQNRENPNSENLENDPRSPPHTLLWDKLAEYFDRTAAQKEQQRHSSTTPPNHLTPASPPLPNISQPEETRTNEFDNTSPSNTGFQHSSNTNTDKMPTNSSHISLHPAVESPLVTTQHNNSSSTTSQQTHTPATQASSNSTTRVVPSERPRRDRHIPQRYGDYFVHNVQTGRQANLSTTKSDDQLFTVGNGNRRHEETWDDNSKLDRLAKVTTDEIREHRLRFDQLTNEERESDQRENKQRRSTDSRLQTPKANSVDREIYKQQQVLKEECQQFLQTLHHRQGEWWFDSILPIVDDILSSVSSTSQHNQPSTLLHPTSTSSSSMAQAAIDLKKRNKSSQGDSDSSSEFSWDSESSSDESSHPSDKSARTSYIHHSSKAPTSLSNIHHSTITTNQHTPTTQQHTTPTSLSNTSTNQHNTTTPLQSSSQPSSLPLPTLRSTSPALQPIVTLKHTVKLPAVFTGKITVKTERKMTEDQQFDATTNKRSWISPATQADMEAALDFEALQCKHCLYVATSRRGLKAHVTQHFWRYFCACTYNSTAWDTVHRHQSKKDCSHNIIHRVDEISYVNFHTNMGWREVPPYLPLRSREPKGKASAKKKNIISKSTVSVKSLSAVNTSSTTSPVINTSSTSSPAIYTSPTLSSTINNSSTKSTTAASNPEPSLQIHNDIQLEEFENLPSTSKAISPVKWEKKISPPSSSSPTPITTKQLQAALHHYRIPKKKDSQVQPVRDPSPATSPPRRTVLPSTRSSSHHRSTHRQPARCYKIQPRQPDRRGKRRLREVADELTHRALRTKVDWMQLAEQAEEARREYERLKNKAKDLYRQLSDDEEG